MIITCLGMEHNIQFIHCDCEPLPLTMVRANLWPNLWPQHPRYVFTFNILDWAEALLLESHVALKIFVILYISDVLIPLQRYFV